MNNSSNHQTKKYKTFNIFNIRKLSVIHNKQKLKNKRHLSAEGFLLLPSALRPRLSKALLSMIIILSLVLQSFILTPVFADDFLEEIDSDKNPDIAPISEKDIMSIAASSLTLTVPSRISLNITPNNAGVYLKSNNATVSVQTSTNYGYTLSVSAKNSNNLVNGSNNLPSITSAISESTFSSDGQYVNKWGYIPSKLNNNANSNVQPGPSASATNIEKTTAANSQANNYTFALATKVNSSLSPGNYTNAFVFTAVANTAPYKITYNLNSGTWSGTSPQTGSTTNGTINLDSHTPSRSNYTFLGWCDKSTSSDSCSGHTYAAGATYPYTGSLSASGNTVTLYAMWKQNVIYRSYTITYVSNLGGTVPSKQTGSAASTNSYKINLSSSRPTLSGYTFLGWCTSSTSTDSCSGSTYQPSASYTISSNGASIKLYAIWKADKPASCTGTIPASPNQYLGGRRWTKTYVRCNWNDAMKVCPSGYRLPTWEEFISLLDSVGTGSYLYNQGWTPDFYWSSTEVGVGNSYAYYLDVDTTYANTGTMSQSKGVVLGVRCIAN